MTVAAAPSIVFSIAPEQASDRDVVDALVLAAFGPGRYAKTAERLRERARLAAGFVATEDGRVVGSVRLWSVAVGETSALFLGPIAVAADSRRGGLGADLVAASVEEARRAGVGGVLLIGVGVIALGALVFAAVQTLRADDELWVADDDADTKA